MDLKALRAQYADTMKAAEEIRKQFDGSAKDMSSADEEKWEGLLKEAEAIRRQIERVERLESLTAWGNDSAGKIGLIGSGTKSEERMLESGIKLIDGREVRFNAEQSKAFGKFLRGGLRGLTASEEKALQADNPAGGGFLVAPQEFVAMLLTNVKDSVFIRQLATVYTLDHAETMGVPTLETDLNDADWTQELATGTEDTALAFGKRELKPNPLAKRIKLSNKLLRQANINPEAVIRDRAAYKFAVTEEKAFLSGTGAGQPLGVFTASTSGISTARDTTAAANNAVAGDDFIETKHSLKGNYWTRPGLRWVIHRTVLKAVRKLKDTTNNYIWAPGGLGGIGLGPGGGLTGGLPGTILDVPYAMSEYAPNTMTTGLYVAIIGDFSFYWICDALDMQVQVLDQLYAETNQTGYIFRKETDGMPVLEEPFQRLKLA